MEGHSPRCSAATGTLIVEVPVFLIAMPLRNAEKMQKLREQSALRMYAVASKWLLKPYPPQRY